MAKLKSVLDQFQKIKQSLQEEEAKKTGNSGEYNDELFFKPMAVKDADRTKFKIRFLPVEETSIGKPWVKIDFHMFERQGDNKYIKVIDPRTFDVNAQNPIADLAKKLFDSGNALDKKMASKLYKKGRYFTLVYVKEAPENQKQYEGKVLIYEAGKQVYDKLDSAIKDFEMCFWDPYKGRDFLLVIKETAGEETWANYSDSAFIGNDCSITDNEKQMDYIATQLEKIKIKETIINRQGIKSGAELKALLEGGTRSAEINASPAQDLIENTKVSSTPDLNFGAIETIPEKKSEPVMKKIEAKADAKPEAKAEPIPETKTNEIVEEKEENFDEFNVEFNEEDFKL